jgi:VanZ family protein
MLSRYNLHAFLWILVMIFLNTYRSQSLPDLQMGAFLPFDKFAHFTQFLILSFLLLTGLSKQNVSPKIKLRALRYTLYICISLSIFLESWQFYFLNSYFQISDSLANMIGIGAGILLFWLIYKKK